MSFGALSFTSPLILAALIALPAIWLLLRATPPAPQRVRFPAFIILRELTTQEETPEKTPWWLLVLRLSLAALVIVGLAGPILNAPKPAVGAGPLVFVVDNSWAAAPAWRERANALKAGAEEAIESKRPIFIVTTATVPDKDPIRPLTGEEARSLINSVRPQPFRADRRAWADGLAGLDDALAQQKGAPEIRWLSDGLASEADADFAAALQKRGALAVYADDAPPAIVLRALGVSAKGRRYRIERLSAATPWSGALVALARDGRELIRQGAAMKAGQRSVDIDLDLPLALRNDLQSVAIDNVASAGAV
ncbi:MAG TPA: BatA domain-containing protein, partial [Parvularculaceae bacterium]|nr:BatA domain-containing protein [Parvularculaceae bacterium]